jgi:hypothetical protein
MLLLMNVTKMIIIVIKRHCLKIDCTHNQKDKRSTRKKNFGSWGNLVEVKKNHLKA